MSALTDTEAEALGEDIRDGHNEPDDDAVLYGPLWPNAYAVVWPRSSGGGTCSHSAPDSCPRCDGTWDDLREAEKVRQAAQRAGVTP